MAHGFPSRRLVVPSTLLVALVVASAVSAQDVLALEPEFGLYPGDGGESRVTTFEGVVHDPSGAPAEGAVVVSSAGGKTVTDRNGSYRLDVHVPLEAGSVQITAVSGAGENLLASKHVGLPAGFGQVHVGSLELAASGTCSPAWLPTFGGPPGVNGPPGMNPAVLALAVYDDGNGPAVYAAGEFTSATGVAANNIAKWDGSSWTALGSGLGGGRVHSLTVYDDGTGPALYAGGEFNTAGGMTANSIAKWDGSSWMDLGGGMNSWVLVLTVYDDGEGPALYAGGRFTTAGSVTANRIAKWNGSTWAQLGGGANDSVYALAVYDDGGGPMLVAGGDFTTIGGVPANHVAKWNGSDWATLGNGMNDRVVGMTIYDDGGGVALYAGGDFTAAGGVAANHVARWDGSSWTALGGGMDDTVVVLLPHDDGNGPALYAGGGFTTADGVPANNIAKWDGSSWTAVGSGTSSAVYHLVVYDDGGGPALYAGGAFLFAGGLEVNYVAKWQGSSWTTLGNGLSYVVNALTVYDDGGGPALYAGGGFITAGGLAVNYIAKWDGSNWMALGSGLNDAATALTVHDDGDGPALYAGGRFTNAGGVNANHVAKWDGSSWTPLGSGVNGSFGGSAPVVRALATFPDGDTSALCVGGVFSSAGAATANNIAKWDGSTWRSMGGGMNSDVRALTVYDAGAGQALYAGGRFTVAGGEPLNHVAKWNGSAWTPLGSGLNDAVHALTVYDGGDGPALCAAGRFTTAGGLQALRVAMWDGLSWMALGSGIGSTFPNGGNVDALTVFDDGGGPALYAGGGFGTAGGVAANNIAKWDGSSWAALGSGQSSGNVFALTVYDDGGGLALYAGGLFAPASGDAYMAKWGCALPSPTTYCTAGMSASGCQALLSASGTASATASSGFTLQAGTVEGQKDGLFFFGTNGQQANSWGNSTSYQCVVPPVIRTNLLTGTGTIGLCDGALSLDMNTVWTNQPTKNPGAGAVVQAQLWYRDPFNTANNQKTSLSDAIEFAVAP